MTTPLVFQHGPAAVAFTVELGAWVVFEAVMRVRQRLVPGGLLTAHVPAGPVVCGA